MDRHNREGLQKGMRKLLGMMDTFIILIMVMIFHESIDVKTYQSVYFKCVVYCMSIISR